MLTGLRVFSPHSSFLESAAERLLLFREFLSASESCSFICGQPIHFLSWPPCLPGLHFNCLKQLSDMLPLIFIRRSGKCRQRHALRINKKVNQNSLSLHIHAQLQLRHPSQGEKEPSTAPDFQLISPSFCAAPRILAFNSSIVPSDCQVFSQR